MPGEHGDRYVGRASELRRLTAARRQVEEGRGQAVLVTGPAGIGKTRLCEEGALLAEDAGFTVAWGRCWNDGGAPALWPWQPVLAELCGPEAARLLDHDSGVDVVGPERFSRFLAVVDRLSGRSRPSYLVLDDLHAAEPAAMLLTRFVARMRHRLRMLIVVTAREAAAGERSARAIELLEPESTRIKLGRLSAADTGALPVAHGGLEVDPALISVVHTTTAGNPLYLKRLLALADLDRTAGLADGMRDAVQESIRRVGHESLAVLAVAALLGPVCSVTETAAVAGVGAGRVLQAVDGARPLGLIGRTDVESFEFSHELVRAAIAGTLSAAERLDVHARTAAVLRGWGSVTSHERLARRAHHARRAAARSPADARQAVAACRAAARSMTARFDYEQAAELLATAAGLHEHGSVGPPPVGLLVEWARAVLSCGRLAEARVLFERAVEAAQGDVDPVLRAEAALGLGGVWVNEHRDLAERERVLALQRAALAELGPDQDVLRCRLHIRLAAELVYSGGPLDDVLAGLDDARRLGDRPALAEALSLTHHVLLRPDRIAERLALAEELVEVASAAGDGVLVLMGLCWRAVDLFHLGDPRAERALADLRARADALNSRSILYVVSVLDVMLMIRSGRLGDSEAAAAACYRQGLEVGDADAFGYYAAHLLAIRWMQGRGAELVDLAAEAADSPTLVQAEFAFQATVARLAAEAGQRGRARRALDRLTGAGLAALPQSSTWLTGMVGIVEAAVALDDVDVAREAYRLLLPFADLPVMPSLAVVCFGSVHRWLGLAAQAAGDLDTAVGHLEQAVTANTRLANRPMAACCEAELALALLRRGSRADQQRSRGLLDAATREADGMGMSVRAGRWRAARPEPAELAARVTVRRDRDHWTVAFAGHRATVADLAGMRYLASLLAHPGRSIPALELAGNAAGMPEPSRQAIVDDRARAAYAARARQLAAEVAEARSDGDLRRVEQLEAEIETLTRELDRATGLSGRRREFVVPAERARTAVRKAVKRALDAVEAADAVVAAELRATINTGYQCSYIPDDTVAHRPQSTSRQS